jgi:hypothetical protein
MTQALYVHMNNKIIKKYICWYASADICISPFKMHITLAYLRASVFQVLPILLENRANNLITHINDMLFQINIERSLILSIGFININYQILK